METLSSSVGVAPILLTGPEGTRITRPITLKLTDLSLHGIMRAIRYRRHFARSLIRELDGERLSLVPLEHAYFPPDRITGYTDAIIVLLDLCAVVVIEFLCDQWVLLSANCSKL